MGSLVIRRARVRDGDPVDVRVVGGAIAEVGPRLAGAAGSEEIDAGGKWLIPGLHDHHIHLRSLVAARCSVRVGPPDVTNADGFRAALRGAPRWETDDWIRAIGYHESVGGDLDAAALDTVVRYRPVRVQHRSGILWVLNSAAVERLGAAADGAAGIERDEHGQPTGRLWRMDRWLSERTAASDTGPWSLGISALSKEAAAMGVTGWTDATPGRDDGATHDLVEAVATGRVMQRLHLMMRPGDDGRAVSGSGFDRVTPGPVKVILDDSDLPSLGSLSALIREARRAGRGAAVHCVTRVQLIFAMSAFDEAGGAAGADRIEHGAVIPGELIPRLRDQGITVVTQPNFVAERGDDYLRSVDPDEVPNLWRARSLVEGGVKVACGTDAPFGRPDPWAALRAATTRRTASGECLGAAERVDAVTAAGWWWGIPDRPASPRRIETGAPADLALLAEPLEQVVHDGAVPEVIATVVAGNVVHP